MVIMFCLCKPLCANSTIHTTIPLNLCLKSNKLTACFPVKLKGTTVCFTIILILNYIYVFFSRCERKLQYGYYHQASKLYSSSTGGHQCSSLQIQRNCLPPKIEIYLLIASESFDICQRKGKVYSDGNPVENKKGS